MRIVFVGDFRYNSGSSHVIYNYYRQGLKLGHQISISSEYGSLDAEIQRFLPISASLKYADRIVFVFESNLYLSKLQIQTVSNLVPRQHRIIIDPDGRANPTIAVGEDTNHDPPDSGVVWHDTYQQLSDLILQPTLSEPAPGVRRFLYFALDQQPKYDTRETPFTVLYIGNNWYRWHDILWLTNGIAPIRASLGRIALKGKWWNGLAKDGLEKATYSDTGFLARHRIETYPSVPFGGVIDAMSEGLINPIFVRPMLAAQYLVTPRMFETLSSHTVPVLGPNATYVAALYGDAAKSLSLLPNPADTINSILENPDRYASVVSEIRETLNYEHNYAVRYRQLIEMIG